MRPLELAAAEYINAGLSVIALDGKLPNTDIHPHGLREPISGTVEEPEDWATVIRVFRHPRTTGVGIVIQAPYVVVDVDGEEGAVQLRDMGVTDNDLLGTPIAKTSRGLHIWYRVEGEQRTTKLGAKLDLKGVGGYVAAPPSLHPSGVTYEWLVPWVIGVEDIPAPIATYLADTRAEVEHRALRASNQQGSLDALTRHVRLLEEGNRNNGLHWAANAARDDGFAFEQAAPALLEAAVKAGLDRGEAMTAIRSAYRRGR